MIVERLIVRQRAAGSATGHALAFPTLQGAAQQGVQLWVDLSLLLQHVEEQLVLGGAVDLRLLQPPLHHLQLGVLLSRLQALKKKKTPMT